MSLSASKCGKQVIKLEDYLNNQKQQQQIQKQRKCNELQNVIVWKSEQKNKISQKYAKLHGGC